MAQRKQINNIVELSTSVARIRKWLDTYSINYSVQNQIREKQEQIDAIKREGAADGEISSKYKNLVLAYDALRKLIKLRDLLKKASEKELTGRELEALQKHKAVLSDTAPADVDKDAFKPRGFAVVVKNTKLDNLEQVQQLVQELQDQPGLQVFLQKSALQSQKIRFSEESLIGIATTVEFIINEFTVGAMRGAAKLNKKTIQPEHLLNTEYTSMSVFTLLHRLPHFEAVLARERRRTAFDARVKQQRADLYKKARKRCQEAGREFTSKDHPNLNELTGFAENEERDGYAIKRDGKYYWKNIDFAGDFDDKQSGRFDHYIDKAYKQLKINDESIELADSSLTSSFKISKSIKCVLSQVVVDFLHRISPKLRELVDLAGVKTVDSDMVVAVLKIMLSDNYTSYDGKINWTEDHKQLFSAIELKIKKLREYNSK